MELAGFHNRDFDVKFNYDPALEQLSSYAIVFGMDDSEAQEYIAGVNKKYRNLAASLHQCFVAQGCLSYVKTIYVGYEVEGKMVAALYRHEDRVEIALALDENHISQILIDATHLTWRTMPVAAVVRNDDDLKKSLHLVVEACNRVKTGKNTLSRSNAFFAEAKKKRMLSDQILKKKKKRRLANATLRRSKSSPAKNNSIKSGKGKVNPTIRKKITE